MNSNIFFSHCSSFSSGIWNTICDVAKPLFAKDCFYSHDTYFEGYTKRNKDWFDHDCIVARNMYLEALKLFYVDKSDTNRSTLCDAKTNYKNIVRKKKHADYKKTYVRIGKFTPK